MNGKTQSLNFDLVRLSKSKLAVDLCSNTIRRFAAEGLPLYRNGKAVFFSKAELESFIRARSPRTS
jgi:hypothetical protein